MTEINDEVMASIANLLEDFLHDTIGEKIGFALLIFPFETQGMTNFISSARPKDLIKVMEKVLEKIKIDKDVMDGKG